MNTKTKVIGGIILGAALGTVTGLMLAPRSGRKTRKKLKAESKRLANDLIEKANESLDSAKKAYNHKIEEYTKNGKSSIDNLTDTIKV